jgi:hypothetical protein
MMSVMIRTSFWRSDHLSTAHDNIGVRFVFVMFEFPDHYGDVGHHLLVQDAPSFIEKFMMSMQFWSQVVFVYISKKCPFFIDFHVLAFPGSSRAHQFSSVVTLGRHTFPYTAHVTQQRCSDMRP